MEESATWLLTQGVLGFTTLVEAGVIWRLWTAVESCRRENSLIQKEHSQAILALHDRTLTALSSTNSQLDSNTKAIELVLRRPQP